MPFHAAGDDQTMLSGLAPLLLFKFILLLLRPFNGLFSRTTWVSRHQKGKPFWILLEQEMMGWQWHQLDHMQIICNSLQTDNHASTSPLTTHRFILLVLRFKSILFFFSFELLYVEALVVFRVV